MMKEKAKEFVEIVYHTPNEIEKMGGAWLMRSGNSIAKANYSVGPRIIEHFSIHFILEGEMTFRQPKCQQHVKENDLFCIFPQLPHHYVNANPDKPLRFIWVSLQGKQVEAMLAHAGVTPDHPSLENVLTIEVQRVLERIAETIKNVDTAEELLIVQLIYGLFQELFKHKQSATYHNEEDYMIQQSLKYMDMHYDEGILVQDVVNYLGSVERSKFTKLFRKQIGVSPKHYLQELRMKKGQVMLQETAYQVTEIALSLGYPDLYSFTRAFKQYYGTPPTRYRERYARAQNE